MAGPLDRFVSKYLVIERMSAHAVVSKGYAQQNAMLDNPPIEILLMKERLVRYKTNAYIPYYFEGHIVIVKETYLT